MFWRSGLGWILCLGWIVTGLGESITSHILDEYQMSTQTPILPHGKHSLTPSLSTPSDLVLSKRDSVLTPAEQAQIMVEFQKNPNATLWTVFSKEVIGHWRHMRKHPLIFLMKLPIRVILWVQAVMAEALRDIIASTGWILSSLLHPIRAGRDIKGFFKEMWHSLKALGIMLWKTPLKSLANFFGGFLYFIMHHSVEFTAQTTLLVVCGFAVIGKAVDAVDSALTSLPFVTGSANGIGSFVKGFFYFFHAIDDPLFILNGILPSIQSTSEAARQADSARSTSNKTEISGKISSSNRTEPATTSREDLLSYFNSHPDEAAAFVRRRVYKIDTTIPLQNLTSSQVAKAYQNFVSFVCEHSGGIIISPSLLVLPQGETVSPVVDYRDQCPERRPRQKSWTS